MPTHVIKVNGETANSTTGDIQIPVFYKKVRLTNDEIITLPTTHFELIEAPGVGKTINLISAHAVIFIDTGSAYTGVTGASWSIRDTEYISNPCLVENSLKINGYSKRIFGIPISATGSGDFANQIVTNSSSATFENTSIVMTDDWVGLSNYGGGGANNYADILLVYSIVDL